MLNHGSFAEIFEKIQTENQPQSTDTQDSEHVSKKINAGWETLLEPSHLAFLMGHLSQTTTVVKAANTAYPPRPRPAHNLDVIQASAFEELRFYAPILNNNFNLRELRTAYRLSVLKTHPDQGGTAESFQAVKKSYQILLAFVNK